MIWLRVQDDAGPSSPPLSADAGGKGTNLFDAAAGAWRLRRPLGNERRRRGSGQSPQRFCPAVSAERPGAEEEERRPSRDGSAALDGGNGSFGAEEGEDI